MAQRVLAVLGAIGLVLAAIAVRNVIDDDGDDDPGDQADGDLEIICAYDLRPACDGLDGAHITYQAAATTAGFFAEDSPQVEGVDGWVTSTAWVEVLMSRAADRIGTPTLLATTSVVVAVDPDRTEAIRTLCDGATLWRCLGDQAGRPWGELGSGGSPSWGALKTGLPDADSAAGLGVLASVASGFFDRTDFVSNDFDLDGFRGWLDVLATPSGDGEDDPIWILSTVQGKYSAVGDMAASVAQRGVAVLEPSPAIDIHAVLVPIPGGDDLPDPTTIREELKDFGWTAASGDLPTPTLKPGVMAALHTLWTEVTR